MTDTMRLDLVLSAAVGVRRYHARRSRAEKRVRTARWRLEIRLLCPAPSCCPSAFSTVGKSMLRHSTSGCHGIPGGGSRRRGAVACRAVTAAAAGRSGGRWTAPAREPRVWGRK